MTDHRWRISRFFGELRRRHVIRVSIAYIAVAFVLLQAVDIVAPALELPAWTVTLVVVLLALGFPVAVALAWAFDLSPAGVVRTPPLESAAAAAGQAPAAPAAPAPEPEPPADRSIVVLPLDNLSTDPGDQYFSDGITEDILASLARLRDIRVISRTSAMVYRNRQRTVREIGRELGVATVLEGSVRRAGKRVRIVVQLIDARTDQHMWAETYDRDVEDIFAIQGDVASRIATALDARLSAGERERIARAPTGSIEAYELYLRGRHAWSGRADAGLEESVQHLRAAVGIDPRFALAWAGLADAYLVLAIYGVRAPGDVMPLARDAAEHALAIDAQLGEALTARACVRALYDWDWVGAERDMHHALQCRPQYATAHQWHALHVLAPLGRFAEAHAALERARALDPLSGAIRAGTGFLLMLERRYDEAVAVLRTALGADPDFAVAHLFLGQALLAQGQDAAAAAALDRAAALRPGSPEVEAARARADALAGRVEAATRRCTALAELAAARYVSPVRSASVLLALGRLDEAVDRLERGRDTRAVDFAWLGADPAFDALRRDARFRALLAEAGLPGGA